MEKSMKVFIPCLIGFLLFGCSSEPVSETSIAPSSDYTSNQDTTTEAGYTSPECEAEWRSGNAVSEACRDSAAQNASAWAIEMKKAL